MGTRERLTREGHPRERHVAAAAPLHPMLRLQALAGNQATSSLVQPSVQRNASGDCRCGGRCPACSNEFARPGSGQVAVQRDGPATDPDDLTGTPFEKFDPLLKKKLVETGFRGGTTLAKALGNLHLEAVNAMSRVGALLSTIDPGVWQYVAKIKGGWVTDNWGMGVVWTDENAVAARAQKDAGWCKDSPLNPMHESHNNWRRVTVGGGPGLHLILNDAGGGSDIHIDAHQPVKGKSKDGSCDLDMLGTLGHMWEVKGAMAGELVGARETPVGRYSWARGKIGENPRSGSDKAMAKIELDAIESAVTRYAAMGTLVDGKLSEGDKAMQADTATMAHLDKAVDLVTFVPDLDTPGGF